MSKSVRIHLIRHAESEANTVSGIIVGRSETSPLTTLGRNQSRRLGESLVRTGIDFDSVYASPAVRAVQTAQIALASLPGQPEIVVDQRLNEIDQGRWTGWPREKAYTDKVIEQIQRELKDFKAPGGESMHGVSERMVNWAEEITSEKTGQIAAFTHTVAISCLLGALFNKSHAEIRELSKTIEKTSITMIEWHDGSWKLVDIGCMPANFR